MHDRAREVGLREIYTPVDEDAKRDLAGELVQAEAVLQTLPPMERGRAMQIALRRLAFQAIYQFDASPAASAADIEVFLERVPGMSAKEIDRAGELIAGAWGARAEADKELGELSPDWPVHRLAGVDRAIMRLAHYEITAGVVHPRIAVNEAVELAKAFSTEKSPAFINAILDRVLKRVLGDKAEQDPPEGTGVLEPGRGS